MRVKETLKLKNYFSKLLYIFDLELNFRVKFFDGGRGKSVIFWWGLFNRWVECLPRKPFFGELFFNTKAFFNENPFLMRKLFLM